MMQLMMVCGRAAGCSHQQWSQSAPLEGSHAAALGLQDTYRHVYARAYLLVSKQ
jgi:hypothetical protein